MASMFTANRPAMQPRPYQAEAIDALDKHLNEKTNNPCIVLPTGAGKSPVMAWVIQRYKLAYPAFRCIVLAHVKELVEQNADKLRAVWPEAPIGVYSAGLRSKQMRQDITFASVDSVYRRGFDFEPFDLILVDEAHRIPPKGEGKYRRFIADCKLNNPRVRVAGLTATPYRMGIGEICHRDHVLNEVAYEANVRDLIDTGFLCPLRSKVGQSTPDVTGIRRRGGEYVAKDLAEATDRPGLVAETIREAMPMLKDRQGIIFFCVDVGHCQHVSQELKRHGVDAPCITGNTPQGERDRITAKFVDGDLRAICNVNVLTEGFDATRCDAVVLLRPTESKGLYYQMVGRGLRLDPRKADCLVLDFAGCIDAHGPIDLLTGEEVKLATCPECRESFSKAISKCPACGWLVPKVEIEDREASEGERKLHGSKLSGRNVLSSSEPETVPVSAVLVNRHRKPGAPDSVRITYRCGLSTFREWICLDHPGYAGQKARSWWRQRFGDPVPDVESALSDLFLSAKLSTMTEEITIRQAGKYPEVVAVKLKQPDTSELKALYD